MEHKRPLKDATNIKKCNAIKMGLGKLFETWNIEVLYFGLLNHI